MKSKVIIFCVFTLLTDLVASIPFYEDQRTNQFGEYQNPGASHAGNAPEQWSANLARSQNANIMPGSTFEGQLPGYQNPTTNNFGIPLGNNRPLNVPQQNYNEFSNNVRVQNEDVIAQAPAILSDVSYSRPISEPFMNPTSVERQNYFTGSQSNLPQNFENYHALQTGVTDNIEQLSLQSVPQTYPSGSLTQNTRVLENVQHIREPYQSATPIRHENYNNLGNPHLAEPLIPNRNEHLQAIQNPYQNTGSIKQIYNGGKLHNIPEQIGIVRTQAQQFNLPEQPIYPLQPSNEGYYEEHNTHHLNMFNPIIKEVLQTTPNKKRYMVIHSDGTIQHTDSLSPALVNNPNYIMLTGGKIVPKEILPVIPGSPITFPPGLKQPVISETNQPIGNNQSPVASVSNGPPVKSVNNYPLGSTTTDDDSDPRENSITSTSPNPLTTTIPILTKTPVVVTMTTTTASSIKNTTSSTPTSTVVPAPNVINSTSTNSSTTTKPNKKYNPIDIILNDKQNSLQNHTALDEKNPKKNTATTPTPTNHPETTTKNKKDKNLLPTSLGNNTTSTAPQPSTNKTTTTPSRNKNNRENNTTSQPNVEKLTITTSPKTTSANNTKNNNDSTTPEEVEEPEEELSEVEKDPKANNTPIKKDDKAGLNGKHCGVVSKEFIQKLYYANNKPDTLFVFQVQNQPLIEKDVKRTIFPNGTIVEEITEFIDEDNNSDDFDDDEYYEC